MRVIDLGDGEVDRRTLRTAITYYMENILFCRLLQDILEIPPQEYEAVRFLIRDRVDRRPAARTPDRADVLPHTGSPSR